MKALVTGATGFIGRRLAHNLLSRGVRVRVLARDLGRAEALQAAGAEVWRGDLTDPASLGGVADGVDVVHHLASAISGPWERFLAVDVQGTERLLEVAARAGVSRFLFASTLAVYESGAEVHGGLLDETSPLERPGRAGRYGRAKVEAEALVRAAAARGMLETVIIRPGLVYGPGRDPWLSDAPHLGVRAGRWFLVLGDADAPLPLVFVDDVAEGLRLAADASEAPGCAFNLVDATAPTRREYLAALTRLTGTRYRLIALPRWIAYPVGAAAVLAARLAGREPTTTPKRLLAKATSPRFSAGRARHALGWTPRVPFEEGLERAVRWWRSEAAQNGGAKDGTPVETGDRRDAPAVPVRTRQPRTGQRP